MSLDDTLRTGLTAWPVVDGSGEIASNLDNDSLLLCALRSNPELMIGCASGLL